MVLVSVKLKKANAPTYVEYFNTLPTWEGLTSRIAERYNVLKQDTAVGYLDGTGDSVTLIHDQGLQEYYKSLDQSSKIKFVVLDRHTPDTRASIIASWPSDYSLYELSNSVNLFCWVLSTSGTDKTEPFSVDIGKEKTVDSLKKKMKEEQKHTFAGIDSRAFVLWKLSEPIPSVGDVTLELIKHPEEIRGCTKLNPVDNIETHFPSPLPAHIHIIVQLPTSSRKCSRSPDEAQASKKKQYSAAGSPDITKKRKAEAEPDTDHEQPPRNIGAPESSKRLKIDRDQGGEDRQLPSEAPRGSYNLREWDLLWHTFWGNSAPQCFGKGSARIPDPRTLETPSEETNYEYLKLPSDDDFFPCNLRRILITKTYTSLYALLCEQDELYTKLPREKRLSSLKHSTIIAGQPGTGKTVSLSCILVWRLQEKKPTVYCNDNTCAYVFTSTGVKEVSLSNRKRIEQLDKSTDCCALVDINPDLLEAPLQFRPSLTRQGRVVVATSPNLDHVTIFKQDHARTYYTPTWKWADLYCASLVQFHDVDPETLRNAYMRLAGIPRRCF